MLIDADFFIGFLRPIDAHHKVCLSLSNKLQQEVVTSWDVIDEVTTKLSYYTTKEISLKFLDMIEKEEINIVYPTPGLFLQAISIFQKQTSKHVSLTDCMNMAIAKEKKIEYFLSFDTVYEKNGFKLVK